MIYRIKGRYMYPEGRNKEVYVLKEVIRNDVYVFECGHRVLGSVFEDLIDLKTGLASWQVPKQLEIF